MKTIAKYLTERGDFCPECNSIDVEGGFVETGGGKATQKRSCLNCGTTWFDIYVLASIEMDHGATIPENLRS